MIKESQKVNANARDEHDTECVGWIERERERATKLLFLSLKLRCESSFYLYIIMLNSWPLKKPLYYISSVRHYAHLPFFQFSATV